MAEMLELIAIHGEHPHMRAGASDMLDRIPPPNWGGEDSPLSAPRPPGSRIMPTTPDMDDDDFSASGVRQGDAKSQRRKPRTPDTPPSDGERRPRGGDDRRRGAPQKSNSRRKGRHRTGLEFSDDDSDEDDIDEGGDVIRGLGAFGKGLDLESLSSDSSSDDEDFRLPARGNARGGGSKSNHDSNVGVMTAMRRFDRQIMELCNALGGKVAPRRAGSTSRKQKSRERKGKASHRLEDNEFEDENFPIHRDFKGDLRAELGPDWQPMADRLQQSPPNWSEAEGDPPCAADRAPGGYAANRSKARGQAPAREAPRALSDQAAAARNAENRRKEMWGLGP